MCRETSFNDEIKQASAAHTRGEGKNKDGLWDSDAQKVVGACEERGGGASEERGGTEYVQRLGQRRTACMPVI